MNIDQHILTVLANSGTTGRPVTIGDLARHFGVSSTVARLAAQRLVDQDLATPSMVLVHSVPTLHGLLPVTAAAPAPTA